MNRKKNKQRKPNHIIALFLFDTDFYFNSKCLNISLNSNAAPCKLIFFCYATEILRLSHRLTQWKSGGYKLSVRLFSHQWSTSTGFQSTSIIAQTNILRVGFVKYISQARAQNIIINPYDLFWVYFVERLRRKKKFIKLIIIHKTIITTSRARVSGAVECRNSAYNNDPSWY